MSSLKHRKEHELKKNHLFDNDADYDRDDVYGHHSLYNTSGTNRTLGAMEDTWNDKRAVCFSAFDLHGPFYCRNDTACLL